VAFEHCRDRLLLNRGGRDATGRVDARVYARIKREWFEILAWNTGHEIV